VGRNQGGLVLRWVVRGGLTRSLLSEPAVDGVVDVVIVEPFARAEDPLKPEAEPLGDAPTRGIPNGTPDLDAVEIELRDTPGCHRLDCTGHEPSSGEIAAEPVADGGFPVGPVNPLETDHAGKVAPLDDPAVKALAEANLLGGGNDERAAVDGGLGCIDPGEPLPEPGAIPVNELEHRRRIGRTEEAQDCIGAERQSIWCGQRINHRT